MKCPGQDTRYWKPDAIFEVACPKCGRAVEFFRDDTARNCPSCNHRFVNPNMDFGCASYCEYAEQCLGTLPQELLTLKEDLLKDRVAVEMKRYFKTDFKRIGHAMRTARYAERIGKAERANLAVILAAAYLHDIGMIEAGRKYGEQAWHFHEQEGPVVAGAILRKLGAKDDLINAVCDIIAHHHTPRAEETIEFKVVYDADLIANLEDQQKRDSECGNRLKTIIATSFFTEHGKKEAEKRLLG